jgi:hypothetical protein
MDFKKHPSINKIREQFRLEQSNTEVLYAHIGAGDVYQRKKEFLKKMRESKMFCLTVVNKLNVISVIKKLIALILFNSRFIY